jgi:glucosyl-dolichyl phosphate glucuronosyltransferase
VKQSDSYISVVAPTRNRSSILEKFLISINRQNLPSSEFEVIIVDNGSTDNTRKLVEEFMGTMPNLRYLYEPNPGLHAGRHLGFAEAHGDILVYADDDIEAFPTWLESIQKCFQNPKVAMVGGKNLPSFESKPPRWLEYMWKPQYSGDKILGHLSILDMGEEKKEIEPWLIFGCNFSIRRHVLRESGGFHPDGMPQNLIQYRGDGETWVSQYVESQGYIAVYHPEASVYHWVSNERMTLEYFCRRAYNQGISDSYTKIRQTNGLPSIPEIISPRSSKLTALIAKTKLFYTKISSKSIGQLRRLFSGKVKIYKYFSGVEVELRKMQKKINTAYQSGYDFHQQAVLDDPDLLTWVLQPNYWDPSLPKVLVDQP